MSNNLFLLWFMSMHKVNWKIMLIEVTWGSILGSPSSRIILGKCHNQQRVCGDDGKWGCSVSICCISKTRYLPLIIARWSGVAPSHSGFHASSFAPALINSFTMLTFPVFTAAWRGVFPEGDVSLTSTLACTKKIKKIDLKPRARVKYFVHSLLSYCP